MCLPWVQRERARVGWEPWLGKHQIAFRKIRRSSFLGVVWSTVFLGHKNQILLFACLDSWNTVGIQKCVLNE